MYSLNWRTISSPTEYRPVTVKYGTEKPHKPPAHYEKVIKRSTRRLFKSKIFHSVPLIVTGKEKKKRKKPTPNPKTQNSRPHSVHALLYITGKIPET